MAFSFDSPQFLAALILLVVTMGSWHAARNLRAGMRVPLRFAAVLWAACAVALPIPVSGLAFNVVLMTAGMASAALALAFCFHPGMPSWISAMVLAAALVMGLGASLAAAPLPVFACMVCAAGYIAVACIARWRADRLAAIAAMLGAASLILGATTILDDALVPAALFFAAALGLVARALKAPVVIADARIELLVGAQRT